MASARERRNYTSRVTDPEKLAQGGIVRLARLALDIFQVLGEPKAQASQEAAKFVVRVTDGSKDVWSVQVVPILCAAIRLE